uniref:Uncharacterized protein n=1 Tax=Oryza brachyantha TaxID=4533 RepID=J3MSS1_ORYBR
MATSDGRFLLYGDGKRWKRQRKVFTFFPLSHWLIPFVFSPFLVDAGRRVYVRRTIRSAAGPGGPTAAAPSCGVRRPKATGGCRPSEKEKLDPTSCSVRGGDDGCPRSRAAGDEDHATRAAPGRHQSPSVAAATRGERRRGPSPPPPLASTGPPRKWPNTYRSNHASPQCSWWRALTHLDGSLFQRDGGRQFPSIAPNGRLTACYSKTWHMFLLNCNFWGVCRLGIGIGSRNYL